MKSQKIHSSFSDEDVPNKPQQKQQPPKQKKKKKKQNKKKESEKEEKKEDTLQIQYHWKKNGKEQEKMPAQNYRIRGFDYNYALLKRLAKKRDNYPDCFPGWKKNDWSHKHSNKIVGKDFLCVIKQRHGCTVSDRQKKANTQIMTEIHLHWRGATKSSGSKYKGKFNYKFTKVVTKTIGTDVFEIKVWDLKTPKWIHKWGQYGMKLMIGECQKQANKFDLTLKEEHADTFNAGLQYGDDLDMNIITGGSRSGTFCQ